MYLPKVMLPTASAFLAVAVAASCGAALAQDFTVLHSFRQSVDGNRPRGLVQARDGNFYVVTESATGGLAMKFTATGEPTVLTRNLFGGPSSILQASDGNFYGAATDPSGQYPGGVIYRMTPAGAVSLLHGFTTAADQGARPSVLLQATDGNLYGATLAGPYLGQGPGLGTIFKLTLNGEYTLLHALRPEDGEGPNALVQGTDGDLYGAAGNGGTALVGQGTLFRVTRSGAFSVLRRFVNHEGSGGGLPTTNLVRGADGAFYGGMAGAGSFTGGRGSVYRFTSAGDFRLLHTFNAPVNGQPFGTLLQAADGSFYGVANAGAFYRLLADGRLSMPLPQYAGEAGYSMRLAQARDGTFYGVAEGGGAYGDGTFFRYEPPSGPCSIAVSAAFKAPWLGFEFRIYTPVALTWNVALIYQSQLSSLWSKPILPSDIGFPLILPAFQFPATGDVQAVTWLSSATQGTFCSHTRPVQR